VATILGFLTPLAAAAQPVAYASTYVPAHAAPVIYRHANILTGAGARLSDTDLLVVGGLIKTIGKDLAAPAGSREVDARERWLTPGLIDVHVHAGVTLRPSTTAANHEIELSNPVTPQAWIEHGIWTQDPAFVALRKGGVTTMQVLTGSPNLFGGRSVVLKNVRAATVQGMKFPGAPQGLKMACGETPKRIYGMRGLAPTSRMGEAAMMREQWVRAQRYKAAWSRFRASGSKGAPPDRDLAMETLVGVLDGEIKIHMHCYRSDDLATMLDVAAEFGIQIGAFHHATDAYKIAPLLKERGTCAAVWADWQPSSLNHREAYDSIPENAAITDSKGACVVIHSDSELEGQRLNQSVARAMAAGRRAGIPVTPEHAIQWATLNSAKLLGIDKRTGSLEVGKAADLVLWSRDPFSVYALADEVLIDGVTVADRKQLVAEESDFALGQPSRRIEP
jgi:imidazolonepropionase-like amidohydrolase